MDVREKTVMGMAEYIEREAAIKELMNDAPEQVGYSREDAADCIRYMDTADVAPERHGRWIEIGYACGETEYQCSECKETEWRTSASRLKYCPNCGARMDAI